MVTGEGQEMLSQGLRVSFRVDTVDSDKGGRSPVTERYPELDLWGKTVDRANSPEIRSPRSSRASLSWIPTLTVFTLVH